MRQTVTRLLDAIGRSAVPSGFGSDTGSVAVSPSFSAGSTHYDSRVHCDTATL
jgi:hypothetical protein